MRKITALAVLLCSPMGLHAQDAIPPGCATRAGFEEMMMDKYGEARVSVALDMNGFMVEVWVNPDNRTWTATVTTPDGVACMAVAGTNYEAVVTIPGVDG